MSKNVRVRFAPSPTGGLHLGGVRTVLYNFLFARRHGGRFILRIEDTDQSRFVEGAEQYIYDCLTWCGLEPDESPAKGGDYGPYRQSERKDSYRSLAERLISQGNAYYAFDTPEELEQMRERHRSAAKPSPQYDHTLRLTMRNSLTLAPAEVQKLLDDGTPHVIRMRMPEDEVISFTDMIRGEVSFHSSQVDDKVLLKADGMPTYHLAVVADDHAMQISHAFRGEEWLPSAPVHVLLWKRLFGLEHMPEWAHFPLILGPNGKLSKRDGAKYGFPVFAMNWRDPRTNELTEGFREKGFMPEAFVNMLALLGWNDGSGQELFSISELIERFRIERIHSGGAHFDFEKAKWFNHEWIKLHGIDTVKQVLTSRLDEERLSYDQQRVNAVAQLVKDRCTLLTDVWPNSQYFFQPPAAIGFASIRPKWNEAKTAFFRQVIAMMATFTPWEAASLETAFKELAAANALKAGDVLLPLRVMLVGQKTGPGVFDIAAILGPEETASRIRHVLDHPELTNQQPPSP